ncbi:MAG: hypothetical protein NZM00_09400, partial [Anaerolinea sp.]|nr:hypothetical protein [Anaerolinea sp.]
YAYEDGATLGLTGSEGGQIIADEEHPAGARITLEQNCLRAPYAITLVIYDWTFITRFTADLPLAEYEYGLIKAQLEADVFPYLETNGDTGDSIDRIADAIMRFVEQYS